VWAAALARRYLPLARGGDEVSGTRLATHMVEMSDDIGPELEFIFELMGLVHARMGANSADGFIVLRPDGHIWVGLESTQVALLHEVDPDCWRLAHSGSC